MAKITKKQILTLCKEVHSSVAYLNHGGCGVFAWLMGKSLEKFENVQYVHVKIRQGWCSEDKELNSSIPSNFKDHREWNKNGIYFNHIVLEVKLRHCKPFCIDSEGIRDISVGYHAGFVMLHHIEDLVKNVQAWNNSFSRYQIPDMIRTFKGFFGQDRRICRDLVIKHWKMA